MKLTIQLINDYIEEAKQVISNCYQEFIPPTITKITIGKARSYWAQITYVDDNNYTLRVSNVFNEINDEHQFHNRMMSCMIHELIHTMPECWNHGAEFKKVARKLNQHNPQLNIGVSTESSSFGVTDDVQVIRYVVTCSTCGVESKYMRKPKIWNYLGKKNNPYYCSCCGKSQFTGVTFD